MQWHILISQHPPIKPHSPLHPHPPHFTMQFFKSTIVAVMAFAAVAVATPWGAPECKPLLQSCAVNSECCGDLCALGVRDLRRLTLEIILTIHYSSALKSFL
ncbi:hypothetical protein FIBSPDRAFT_569623 [Athelia psychrophila]|uniref:Uncharacterized protein n=1 Tax=Athelia psychrophila TaxID=1759441 RepID=A0A166HPU1_9AGAM|nr:hypothetical protein FIBSPDRAFT_569623 [Fibularhizoctonia sp. CBS 109695]